MSSGCVVQGPRQCPGLCQEDHRQSNGHQECVPAQTDSEGEFVDSERSRESQAPYYPEVSEQDTYSPSIENSAHQQQKPDREQDQHSSLHSSDLESYSVSCSGSLDDAQSPCFLPYNGITSSSSAFPSSREKPDEPAPCSSDPTSYPFSGSFLTCSVHHHNKTFNSTKPVISHCANSLSSSSSVCSSPSCPLSRSSSASRLPVLVLLPGPSSPFFDSAPCSPISLSPKPPTVPLPSLSLSPPLYPANHPVRAEVASHCTVNAAIDFGTLASTPSVPSITSDSTPYLHTPASSDLDSASSSLFSIAPCPSRPILPVSPLPSASEYHCSGFAEPITYPASGAQSFETPQPTCNRSLQGSLSATVLPPLVSLSNPLETSVTITTTEIPPSDSCPEKAYYIRRQLQLQRHRQRSQNTPPSISGTKIQPLLLDFLPEEEASEEQQSSVTSELRAQVQGSLDYLEHLETNFLSDQEIKALRKHRRSQSWIAVKNFVGRKILGLSGKVESNINETVSLYRHIRPEHPNHSAPAINRLLLLSTSTSPSPSLPVLRSAPIILSRSASPGPSYQVIFEG
ncbi:hypothetical protein EDD21DRAFT_236752 [Dissophora ornata]|nr:hypothetical protein EDD21DRAFT_236752 [Dissophora ornata]